MKKWDFLWALAYPLYQVVGTIRHEGAHALAGWLQGMEILEVSFLPSTALGYRTWGYVRWRGDGNWLTIFAPYLVDLLTFVIAYIICTRVPFKRHWLWVNVVVIGMVSPLVNSIHNYRVQLIGSDSDVTWLMDKFPDWPFHLYFVGTGLLYIIGIILVFRQGELSKVPKYGTTNP